ncbi:MAG TPA: helix-turn-helix transcriptional regulator, partial [Ruania sp.]|nr:helix-turn-helix transcriptional regulator [Ruania sp.]
PTGSDGQIDDDMPLVTLTVREAQVLHALEEHAGPVGIAHSLGLSVNTVKTHMRSVYRKLDVSNRNEALARVRRIMIHT